MDQDRARTTEGAARKGREEGMKSLGKLVRVLDCFSSSKRTLTLAEIAEETGFPRSTTHRLMASLREVGFLEQDHRRDVYRLGLKLFELGNMALSNFDIHREAYPYAEALERMTGYVVTVAVFDGYRAVVVRRSEGGSDTTTGTHRIENAPAHCTSVGKAALAFQPDDVISRLVGSGLPQFTKNTITDETELREALREIRERGYAVDEGEHRPGLRCIGAPIRDQAGRVFAGLSISGPNWKLLEEDIEQLSAVVIDHADKISESLGYNGTR